MATIKSNADYFSHDCDMRNDVKIKALRRRFSHMGYAVWCFLLEALTDSVGFELPFGEVDRELYAADFDVSLEELNKVVDYCVKIGLLQRTDDTLYSDKHKERFANMLEQRERQRTTNRTNGKRGGNPNFVKGQPNPYYISENTNEGVDKDNRKITDHITEDNRPHNRKITDHITEDNRKITQDNPVEYSIVEYSREKKKKNSSDDELKKEPTTTTDLSEDEIFASLSTDTQWHEAVVKSFPQLKGLDMAGLIRDFRRSCTSRKKMRHEGVEDAARHFCSWVEKRLTHIGKPPIGASPPQTESDMREERRRRQEIEDAEYERHKAQCVTYDEYLRLKQLEKDTT